MKPIEFLGTIFFNLVQIQPRQNYYTTTTIVAKSIVQLDIKQKTEGEDTSSNKRHLKLIEDVQKNTHEELNMPLAVAEAIVASVPTENWRKEYDGKDNSDSQIKVNDRTVTVLDIYRYLKESNEIPINAVVDIVTGYSSEYRLTENMGMFGEGKQETPNFLGGGGNE